MKDLKGLIIALLGLFFGAIGLGTVENVYVEFGTFVVSIALFSEWINSIMELKKFPAMAVTWGTGTVFAFIGWILGVGFFETVTEWYWVLVYGVGAALISNDVWPNVIKKILQYLDLIEEKE